MRFKRLLCTQDFTSPTACSPEVQLPGNLFYYIAVFTLLLSACASEQISDAYGQFEATEVTISAEAGGKLLDFGANEGDRLEAGQRVGLIDTTQAYLKKQELKAQLEAAQSRIISIEAEVAVVEEELALAKTDLERIRSLKEDGAATQKQLNDAQSRVNTQEKRINALQTQKRSVRAETQSIRARLEQADEQLQDAIIINPVNGTVLSTFAESYELVRQGEPLYEIANLDTLILRVFVSGAQLPGVKLNQQVNVLVDKNAEENQQMNGEISWIASEAEFTPKMIQTKEERVNQVYAVKVRVPNPDGILKIGMPGEVNF